MRIAVLAATFLLGASGALAAPAVVTVSISPDLQTKAERTYGVDDVTRLADNLRLHVERALARSGARADERLELVLNDVAPNRPTFKQLGDRPGLSMESFGVGGASFTGRIVGADGVATPVAYRWYESDIRQAVGTAPWSDAERAIDRFASRLARVEKLAQR